MCPLGTTQLLHVYIIQLTYKQHNIQLIISEYLPDTLITHVDYLWEWIYQLNKDGTPKPIIECPPFHRLSLHLTDNE